MLKTVPAFAALVVASVLVVPTVSQAAEPQSVSVSFADLNLASEAGASILERRIGDAARTVCQFEDPRELAMAKAISTCRDRAVDDARPALHAALSAARNPSVTLTGATIAVTAR